MFLKKNCLHYNRVCLFGYLHELSLDSAYYSAMDTSPQISTVSLPSNLADILNRHDLDDEMFMYYLFILKGNDDAIYELTMRRWANIETQTPQNPFESHNLEPQNPIESQVDDPTIPCTSVPQDGLPMLTEA